MNHKRSFRQKLERAVAKHGQVKTAKRLGCSQASVSKWVNGLLEPSLVRKQAMRDKLHALLRE